MKKVLLVCMVVMIIFTMTACTIINTSDEIEKPGITNNIESALDEINEDEVVEESVDIIGHWIIDKVKYNDISYTLDELKELINEDAFNTLQLEFKFTEYEVTVFVNGEEKATTGYQELEENQYVDESSQLIFTIIGSTLQIEQNNSTLILVKQNIENDNNIEIVSEIE